MSFFSLLKVQWVWTHTNLEWWASALPSSGPRLWLGDRQPSHRPLATSLLQLWLGQSEISGPCHWLACHISISHWSTTPPSGGEGMQLTNGNNHFPQCAAKHFFVLKKKNHNFMPNYLNTTRLSYYLLYKYCCSHKRKKQNSQKEFDSLPQLRTFNNKC